MRQILIFILASSLSILPIFQSFVSPAKRELKYLTASARSSEKLSKNGGQVEAKEESKDKVVGFTKSKISSKTSRKSPKSLHANLKKNKTCASGYVLNPATNRCRKLVITTETKTTIYTKTYHPQTGLTTIKKSCKAGYWLNPKTDNCNKRRVCKIGYSYNNSNNSCRKINCPVGYKVQDSSNTCKKLVCEPGHIISQKTGNCVVNRHKKFKECKSGYTLDLRTLQCARIGTKGSEDTKRIEEEERKRLSKKQ